MMWKKKRRNSLFCFSSFFANIPKVDIDECMRWAPGASQRIHSKTKTKKKFKLSGLLKILIWRKDFHFTIKNHNNLEYLYLPELHRTIQIEN